MNYKNNIAAIDELSASEGVFTTAQALRLGITRNALAHACKVSRLERVAHGAYRLAGAPSSSTDELAAIWKLTSPSAFSWERQAEWDGVAVGGATAGAFWESATSTCPPTAFTPPGASTRESRG